MSRNYVYESYEYQRERAENLNAQEAAESYREKYLALRKLIRDYYKGAVTDDEMKYHSGYKGK